MIPGLPLSKQCPFKLWYFCKVVFSALCFPNILFIVFIVKRDVFNKIVLWRLFFIILFSFATWHLFGRGKTVTHFLWDSGLEKNSENTLSAFLTLWDVFAFLKNCLRACLWVSFWFFNWQKCGQCFSKCPFLENCSSRTCGFTGLVSRHSYW